MLSSFFFETAAVCQAGYKDALFFGCFFSHNLGPADRTFTANRLIPGGECAIRKVAAAVKDFTAFGGALDDVSGAAFLRAVNSYFFTVAVGIQRQGVFTFRIPAAGEKTAIAASFNRHGFAAFFAYLIGNFFL